MTAHGRRSLILVQPIHLTSTPNWPTGPLPLHAGATTASASTRASYFTAPCARILYGTPTQPTRWHTFPDERPDTTSGPDKSRIPDPDGPGPSPRQAGPGLLGSEVLVPDPATEPSAGLAIWHLTAQDNDQLELLRAAAGRTTDAKLPGIEAVLRPFAATVKDVRPFSIAFMTQTGPHLSSPRGLSRRLGWTPAQAWLWLLASRTSPADYPPDPEHADRLLTGIVPLSADWRALIARDGAAFDSPDMPRHLEQLETRAARFRTIYWLRDASSHGLGNDILDAYQAQHALPQRFEAVLTEIADLSRILQERQVQRTGAALGILTIVGLPFGIALEALQALAANSITDLALALTAATTTTGVLLTTRIGRLLVRQLRQLK